MYRSEIERAIEDISESRLAWESLRESIIRIAHGDHSAAEAIEDQILSKIQFNREQDEEHREAPEGEECA